MINLSRTVDPNEYKYTFSNSFIHKNRGKRIRTPIEALEVPCVIPYTIPPYHSSYAEKLLPHPQDFTAFGLSNVKPLLSSPE